MPKHDRTVKNALGEVRPCDCGGVNLSTGALTLHIAADETHALFELASAAVEISGRSARPVPRNRRARGLRAPRLLH
jgi:hypothetical protein